MGAIDLYSGMGGWTLGLKLSGIPVLASYEWWKDANSTHNKNFNTNHKEINIRTLKLKDLPTPSLIDFVVGSPPCTQFSLANRGGKGDIADGLIDIYKFLEVVEYLQPKYWAMENVPRVAVILEEQIKKGPLERFAYLFGDIKIFKASDFGVPQDRKRMIAGRFPFNLLESYKERTSLLTLGKVLEAFDKDQVVDPIYGISLNRSEITDHILEANLTTEENRINKETKSHHPVYNKMSFPDRLDRPSRTVTAVCTRVSRESIIVEDAYKNIRRLTIRERGILQSFPINFQFFGSSYNNKIRMIGNAVPPILTYYIAQAMQEKKGKDLLLPNQAIDKVVLGAEHAVSSKPDGQGAKYPWSRTFWMAIEGLRFGSGVRFELKNDIDKEKKTVKWRVNFFYGSSKNIKAKPLNHVLFNRALEIARVFGNDQLLLSLIELRDSIGNVNEKELQANWTNIDRESLGPIELIDRLSHNAKQLKEIIETTIDDHSPFYSFVESELKNISGEMDNRKILEKPIDIYVGILLGSIFNTLMEKRTVLIMELTDELLVSLI